MFSGDSDSEFPNWWDLLDAAGAEDAHGDKGGVSTDISDIPDIPDLGGFAERDIQAVNSGSLSGCCGASEEEELICALPGVRVFESPVVDDTASQVSSSRGYEREVVDSVWNFAEIVAGNDPELWRKDEWGNWIHRLGYGRRDSAFGWEIFDPGIGRHSQGVYAMRPMQWSRYLQQHEVFS
ncbi:MAG: hypothetical protein P1U68_10880 [Verrucomicrobiales bacterium]|nr:hypothetical protein [Verrucomicrobiales bacterium]